MERKWQKKHFTGKLQRWLRSKNMVSWYLPYLQTSSQKLIQRESQEYPSYDTVLLSRYISGNVIYRVIYTRNIGKGTLVWNKGTLVWNKGTLVWNSYWEHSNTWSFCYLSFFCLSVGLPNNSNWWVL